MNLDFKKSFARDLKKRKTDKPLLERVRQIIGEVEEARDIHAIRNLKKLKAQGNHYRIRIGDYRLGLVIEEDTVCFALSGSCIGVKFISFFLRLRAIVYHAPNKLQRI